MIILFLSRSSRPEVFYEIRFLENFAKFTGKDQCWSLFFNKVAQGSGLQLSSEFSDIFKYSVFIEIFRGCFSLFVIQTLADYVYKI